MKKKWMASTALACSCMLLISGCSGNKADDFDAVAYTTAYLDGMIRGNVDTLSSLSGVSSDDLTATFNSMIDDLVSSSIGGDGSSPGSTQISPQLRQDYTDFWKQAFSNTKGSELSPPPKKRDVPHLCSPSRQCYSSMTSQFNSFPPAHRHSAAHFRFCGDPAIKLN